MSKLFFKISEIGMPDFHCRVPFLVCYRQPTMYHWLPSISTFSAKWCNLCVWCIVRFA